MITEQDTATGSLTARRAIFITVGYVEKSGIVAEPLERMARDPETGEWELIPKMSYKEWEAWKKGFESSGENGIIKANKTIIGHNGTPKKSEPNDIIDRINKDGIVTVRCFYDTNGLKEKEIHTTNHNNPKKHPFGKYGEHAHDYQWDEKEKLKQKTTRELTKIERKENASII